jgi:hypothetical protein
MQRNDEKPPYLLENDEDVIRRYVDLAVEQYSGHALTPEWLLSQVMTFSKGSVNPLTAMKIILNNLKS